VVKIKRQPIITVLGHVDHGKTTVLDYIRGTTLAQREAGLITQHIGATEIPLDALQKVCGDLLDVFNLKFTIPGLLFIDTPGHEAFTNLRKRGGSIADLAVLVIDINQGVQPQTKEAIDILKTFKVPFIIAANKIDVLPGWKPHDKTFVVNLVKQIASAKEAYEKKFYQLLGQISEQGFDSNLYTKVEDYKSTIAIVPISAKTGEGIAELLALVTGLAQKFFADKLEIDEKAPAEGTILEIKEEKGMGTTADVVIYNGTLNHLDTIVVGGANEVFKTKVRALLKPDVMCELRDKKTCFDKIDKITAAAGIKVLAPHLDKAIAGAPFMSAHTDEQVDAAKKKIIKEITDVLIETEDEGVVLKADTLGSLEAATNLFKQRDIPIKRADIGDISKRDISEAASNRDKDPLLTFVLGFNVKTTDLVDSEAERQKVTIVNDPVIYKVVEKYEELITEKKKLIELDKVEGLVWPAKVKILSQYIFRQSNPAVFGVEIIAGRLKPKTDLINKEGVVVGTIKSIEDQGEKKEEAKQGEQMALSVSGMTIGRQAQGGDELYVDINERVYRTFKGDAKKFLTKAEIQILKEIAEIKRRDKEHWGL